MKEQKIRYETFDIEIPSGTGPGTYDFKLTVDDSYDRITGVEAYEPSGNPEFKVGIADNTREWINPSPKEFLLTSTAVAQSEKSRKVDIPISNNLKARTEIGDTLSQAVRFQLVFTLTLDPCGH